MCASHFTNPATFITPPPTNRKTYLYGGFFYWWNSEIERAPRARVGVGSAEVKRRQCRAFGETALQGEAESRINPSTKTNRKTDQKKMINFKYILLNINILLNILKALL